MFKQLWLTLTGTALFPLIVKETQQLLRNKQLVFMILFPPTFQLWLFCSALDPQPKNVNVAVYDASATPESRDLIAQVVNTNVFQVAPHINSEHDALDAVKAGKCDIGIVIPPKFNSHIQGHEISPVQVAIDGVDANTSGIEAAYLDQVFSVFNQVLSGRSMLNQLDPRMTFLYNPGLRAAWFFVPGLSGLIVTFVGLMLSASCFVREKDTGTLDQLLMTPADSVEVIIAKIIPNLVGLFITVVLSVVVGMFVFGMPFRGSMFTLGWVSALYLMVTIALGMTMPHSRKARLKPFWRRFSYPSPWCRRQVQ